MRFLMFPAIALCFIYGITHEFIWMELLIGGYLFITGLDSSFDDDYDIWSDEDEDDDIFDYDE